MPDVPEPTTDDLVAIRAEQRRLRELIDRLWGQLDRLQKQTDARLDHVYMEFDQLAATVEGRLAALEGPRERAVGDDIGDNR